MTIDEMKERMKSAMDLKQEVHIRIWNNYVIWRGRITKLTSGTVTLKLLVSQQGKRMLETNFAAIATFRVPVDEIVEHR